MNAKGFFDLCVPEKHFTPDNCVATLKALRKRGYRTVAINHDVEENMESLNENKKKKKKDNGEIVPEPIKIDEKILKDFEDMTVLKRLTVTFSEREFYHKVSKCTNMKKYDILAVRPTTKIAFMFVCTSVEADLIACCAGEKLPYKIDRKSYNHLKNKGFFFELLYGPTIEDQTRRKNIIERAHHYHSYGKSRNIIVSSGLSSLIHLSGAYDVINLGLIFGLNSQQAKDAISHNGMQLCCKAVGRCHGKSIVMVETIVLEDTIAIISDDEECMEVVETETNGKESDPSMIVVED